MEEGEIVWTTCVMPVASIVVGALNAPVATELYSVAATAGTEIHDTFIVPAPQFAATAAAAHVLPPRK